jgi:hypothetical protein
MSNIITEADVEENALDRKTYSDVVLVERLKNALKKLNLNVSKEAKEEAFANLNH